MTCIMSIGTVLASLSTWHIVAVLAVILLLFGGKKLPELARGVAKGLRIFRDELHGAQKEVEDTLETPPPKPDKTPESNEKKLP